MQLPAVLKTVGNNQNIYLKAINYDVEKRENMKEFRNALADYEVQDGS